MSEACTCEEGGGRRDEGRGTRDPELWSSNVASPDNVHRYLQPPYVESLVGGGSVGMVREITTDLFSALWVNSTSQYNTYSSSQLPPT